jgi:hypothetical protein
MILKRRFPNFVDMGPEHWTEHEVNSIEDIHSIEWIQRWIHNDTPLAYSINNPYYNSIKYPYGLIGQVEDETLGISYITIGLFNEDPSTLGLPLHPTRTKAGEGNIPFEKIVV